MWEIELSLCYAMLSKNQKKAADILLEDPDAARTMTVRELAGQAGVGQATVIRMLQAAGYEGWSAFQREVWQEKGKQERGMHEAPAREPASGGKKSPAKREYRKYEAVFQIIRDDLTMISDMAKHLDLRQLEEVVKVIKKAKIIHLPSHMPAITFSSVVCRPYGKPACAITAPSFHHAASCGASKQSAVLMTISSF